MPPRTFALIKAGRVRFLKVEGVLVGCGVCDRAAYAKNACRNEAAAESSEDPAVLPRPSGSCSSPFWLMFIAFLLLYVPRRHS
jgi:hypothetical protein